MGENIDESELQEMIQKADLDRDGLINEDEFYNVMTRKVKWKRNWIIYHIFYSNRFWIQLKRIIKGKMR